MYDMNDYTNKENRENQTPVQEPTPVVDTTYSSVDTPSQETTSSQSNLTTSYVPQYGQEQSYMQVPPSYQEEPKKDDTVVLLEEIRDLLKKIDKVN